MIYNRHEREKEKRGERDKGGARREERKGRGTGGGQRFESTGIVLEMESGKERRKRGRERGRKAFREQVSWALRIQFPKFMDVGVDFMNLDNKTQACHGIQKRSNLSYSLPKEQERREGRRKTNKEERSSLRHQHHIRRERERLVHFCQYVSNNYGKKKCGKKQLTLFWSRQHGSEAGRTGVCPGIPLEAINAKGGHFFRGCLSGTDRL